MHHATRLKNIRFLFIALVLPALVACDAPTAGSNPLPSWNDSASRDEIVSFVSAVTDESGSDYIPPAERIAVFDNDGTLWSEQPIYFQVAFAIDRVKAMAPEHPEWQETEPFKSILSGDLKTALAGGTHAILDIVAKTHGGMTSTEFENVVSDWTSTAVHPASGRRYTEMVYAPMLEMLDYLRANEFKTYIVSGGGIDFMRPWTYDVYGIPPEQVVGSSMKLTYEVRDGTPVLARQPEIEFIDDGPGKPVGIQSHIGRRPVVAFGNSDGDLQMLQWTDGSPYRSLSVIIHHTDGEREWAYDTPSSIGHLDKAMLEANEKGWTVVDMKNDWSKIYPYDE